MQQETACSRKGPAPIRQSPWGQFSLKNLLKNLWSRSGTVSKFSYKLCLVLTYAEHNWRQSFKSRQPSCTRAETLAVSISLQKIPFVYQNLFTLVEKLLSSLIWMWQWIKVYSLLLPDVIMEKLRVSPEDRGGCLFSALGEERLIFPSKNASLRSCINEVQSNAWHLTMLIISSWLAKSSFSSVLEITHLKCNPFPTCYFHKAQGFVLPVWRLRRHLNLVWHDTLKSEKGCIETTSSRLLVLGGFRNTC